MVKRFGSLRAILVLVTIFPTLPGFSKPASRSDLEQRVKAWKQDPRGPYQAIRWFCPDGTILPAKERCSQPGGLQHALLKPEATEIQQRQGIYLGQILAGTAFDAFLDTGHQNSRALQYQLAKYLEAVDDGWIMRRARFYRGAVQAEDEETWGKAFMLWLLAKDDFLASNFFFCRQLRKDIPHSANEDKTDAVRALAKSIADSLPSFMNIRIKIHGKPDGSDLARVRAFHSRNRKRLSPNMNEKLALLAEQLESVYQMTNTQTFSDYLPLFPPNTPVGFQLRQVVRRSPDALSQQVSDVEPSVEHQCQDLAHLLWTIRKQILSTRVAKTRLAMMDLSNQAESILFRKVVGWRPKTIGGLLDKNYVLARASAGAGFLEMWEWERLEPHLLPPKLENAISLRRYLSKVNAARRAVEWGSAMVRAVYNPVADLYAPFEPLATGFIDDRTRGSILLPLGDVVGQLEDLFSQFSGISNDVLGLVDQNQIRGMNPGTALGQLQVVTGPVQDVTFSADKIYVLSKTPSDLKPVAGIATVSEGNAVSHVQLLARNLGIPNAVIREQDLQALRPYSGTTVFYAVSPRGKVVLKSASAMTPREKAMMAALKIDTGKIAVPTDKLDLTDTNLMSLKSLRATDSGRICGPKAANLGQLKSLFPDKVPAGLVIPFAVFRQHLDQIMPGSGQTYWQFLQAPFAGTARDAARGKGVEEIETRLLPQLARLHEAIRNMPLLPAFKTTLARRFADTFGVELGKLPIFIRSDTNMEDLKNFTGAGLNLTIPNVVGKNKTLQAIREVWASPFTERSSRWRQRFLTNPENVYPSLLLLASVNVEKSGVMITAGISSGNPDDLTVAFDWGVGGAVASQAAETYLLRGDGTDVLLSPARQPEFSSLPVTGGIAKQVTPFNKPILSRSERYKLRVLARKIQRVLPGTPGIGTPGPFDVELGFWNESIWLFQVRPFVENEPGRSSAYLNALDPALPDDLQIPLSTEIGPSGDESY